MLRRPTRAGGEGAVKPGDAPRIVLIFDVWHPALELKERKFLDFLRKVDAHRRSCTRALMRAIVIFALQCVVQFVLLLLCRATARVLRLGRGGSRKVFIL